VVDANTERMRIAAQLAGQLLGAPGAGGGGGQPAGKGTVTERGGELNAAEAIDAERAANGARDGASAGELGEEENGFGGDDGGARDGTLDGTSLKEAVLMRPQFAGGRAGANVAARVTDALLNSTDLQEFEGEPGGSGVQAQGWEKIRKKRAKKIPKGRAPKEVPGRHISVQVVFTFVGGDVPVGHLRTPGWFTLLLQHGKEVKFHDWQSIPEWEIYPSGDVVSNPWTWVFWSSAKVSRVTIKVFPFDTGDVLSIFEKENHSLSRVREVPLEKLPKNPLIKLNVLIKGQRKDFFMDSTEGLDYALSKHGIDKYNYSILEFTELTAPGSSQVIGTKVRLVDWNQITNIIVKAEEEDKP